MRQMHMRVTNSSGLHARPASEFVGTGGNFEAEVHIRNITTCSEWVDAKSIISVLGLGVEKGHKVELIIKGPDEAQVFAALQALNHIWTAEAPRVRSSGLVAIPLDHSNLVQMDNSSLSEQGNTPLQLAGVSGSPGMAVGPAILMVGPTVEVDLSLNDDPALEWKRLEGALAQVRAQLVGLHDEVQAEAGQEAAAIFQAHRLFLQDPALLKTVRSHVQVDRLRAEAAWHASIESYAAKLQALPDPYLSARAADLRDVGVQVLGALAGQIAAELPAIEKPSVIVARELAPSETIRLNRDLVLGFCTAEGGPTSHTAILARALGLPAVVALGPTLLDIPGGTPILVDGDRGLIIANPDEPAMDAYRARSGRALRRQQTEREQAGRPAMTRDGRRIEVVANVGDVQDAVAALEVGAEGIGLFRTEFLYLRRETAPGEEEQTNIYRSILDIMEDRPVVLRTLDAADRTNAQVAHLGDACHPAVLRQIERAIAAGHAEGIWVGVCGELAADLEAIPILLGCGLDEFSMSPGAIPAAKALIRRLDYHQAQDIARAALDQETARAVRVCVRQAIDGLQEEHTAR